MIIHTFFHSQDEMQHVGRHIQCGLHDRMKMRPNDYCTAANKSTAFPRVKRAKWKIKWARRNLGYFLWFGHWSENVFEMFESLNMMSKYLCRNNEIHNNHAQIGLHITTDISWQHGWQCLCWFIRMSIHKHLLLLYWFITSVIKWSFVSNLLRSQRWNCIVSPHASSTNVRSYGKVDETKSVSVCDVFRSCVEYSLHE